MKNILFYYAWQLKIVHFGVVLDRLKHEISQGHKIYFLICDGDLKPCYSNREGNEALCKLCVFNSYVGLKEFSDQIEVIKLSEFRELYIEKEFSFNSMNDIKSISYKNYNIGYGALSSFISSTRNLEPEFNSEFRKYINKLLNNQIFLLDILALLREKYDLNEFHFFNGRTAETRPVYEYARSRKIPFKSYEFIKTSKTEYRINIFENTLPHDVDYHYKRLMNIWEDSRTDIKDKIKIGSAFYENRRKGILTRDRSVYVSSQHKGKLPDGFDHSKRNIGIFISSEDEFAAIGDVFERNAVFKTQEVGIVSLLEHFRDDNTIHFYVRVHPNLSEVNYQYHLRLYELDKKYSNVTLIHAKSKVSTYDLVDASDIVIVFGSSVGAEATYSGRPVILLSGTFYYGLEATYKPQSMSELVDLIHSDLPPKEKMEAIKFGYYLMSYIDYTIPNTNDPVYVSVIGRKKTLVFPHLKILRSGLLYRLSYQLLEKIYKLFYNKKHFNIPKKEQQLLN